MQFAATCNYFLLKKDNNKFLKDLLPHLLICLSLMSILIKILFSFSVKKKQPKTLKKLEIGNPAPGQAKFKKSADIQIQQDGDFPVLIQDC